MSDIFMDRVTNAHNIKVETIGNIIYVGKARIGVLPTEAKWSIQQYDKTSWVSSWWADGIAWFEKVWDDKAGYTYS